MSFFSRQIRLPASPKLRTARPRLEPLEERQLLSGFGPEDGAYILGPWVGNYKAVQIQPGDQKIVAAGGMSFTNPDNTTEGRMAIARYDLRDDPDSTYGSGGVSAPALGSSNEGGWDLVLQPDGKAVVAGLNTADSSFALARFNIHGTLDSGFGSGGWTSLNVPGNDFNPAEGVALQSTGKVVVAGTSMGASISSAEVARFTAAGVIDSGKGGFGQIVRGKAIGYTLNTFGMPSNVFHDLAVQPDDKLVTVGLAFTDGTSRRLIVARYTASGTLDTSFNGNGYSLFLPAGISDAFGQAVALQSDGKIVVTGFCTGTDGDSDMLVARYNSNGTLDTSFGGGSGYVRLDDGAGSPSREHGFDVAIQPDGKIVVGGQTRVTGNPTKVLVARLNMDGTPDGTFATGGYKIGATLPNTGSHSFECYGMALKSNGDIIVAGGESDLTTNIGHPFLMRFFPTTASPPQAARGTAPASAHTVPLTVARSQATGADVSALASLDVRIINPPDATLDMASGNTISLDPHAAGWDRFVGRWSRRGRVPQAVRMNPFSALTTR